MPVAELFPRRGSQPGNLNFDTRNGRAVPAFDHYILGDTDRLHYAIGAIETLAPINGHPRQYCGMNKSMFRLDDGLITADATFVDVVQGMELFDTGTTIVTGSAFALNGTPINSKILLVGFGSSSTIKNAYRLTQQADSTWFTSNNALSAQFWGIARAGADLYAVTDAGIAILGEYRISKCPAGNDPTLAASWGNGLEVGSALWAITGIAAIGDSIVVGKPDGLYYYNDQTKRFENVLPFLQDAPHAVNGKGMRAVVNGVMYPTHDGKLYFFDGVRVQEVTPEKTWDVIPRDVANSRITAIADNGDTVAVVRECWQNTTQSLGMKVITNIGGIYTDVTASVTNGSLSDGANVGAFGLFANDAIYVGSDQPIEAVCFRVTRNVNAVAQSFTTPQYSNATAGTVSPFDSSFTSFTGIVDGSILSVAATSLVNTGFPPAASNAFITWTDINAYDLEKLTAISFGGAIGTLTKYWVRLKRTSTLGMTASTTIDEVEIVPARAGLPVAAANDFTHRWRAGGLTIIEMGERHGSAFVWHQVYAVHTYGGVWAAAWHSGRPGQAGGLQNMGQTLMLWGRWRQVAISEGPIRDPARAIAPQIAAYGTKSAGPLLDLAPGGWDGGDSMLMKTLNGFGVDGRFVQPTDRYRAFVQFDEQDVIELGSSFGAPGFVSSGQTGVQFRRLYAWLAFEGSGNAAGLPSAPQTLAVEIDFNWTGQRYEWPRDRATQTPEAI